MQRREFITLLGGAAVAWPLAASAQSLHLPTIGLLSGTNREERLTGAIWKGLNEAGYVEGRNVAMEFRFAEGSFERLPALAAELVQRKVDAIIAIQSVAAPMAAKSATSTIPIIFAIGGDPVKLGIVASLSRPGANATGATFLVNTLSAKRVELAHELVPSAKVIGLLVNPKNPASASETADAQAAARALGLELDISNASTPQEIDAAFARFAGRPVGAVTFAADATFNAARQRLVALAAQYHLPMVHFLREVANVGSLMSYGGFDTDAYQLAGLYAGRILKGEKPADLPVQQVTKVELVINLKTAKALGITVPVSLLGRADDIIE
jgi:putative tryptophan/tyrosine transport system substrate-binding protein